MSGWVETGHCKLSCSFILCAGKLMLVIRKCLNSCIKKAQDQDPDDTTSANKENLSVSATMQ